MIKAASVDEYMAAQPKASRALLGQVRSAIRKAVPGTEEAISYGIPAFKLHGRAFVYCAGWKAHYSLYPANARLVAAFGVRLAPYEVNNKGTIRFPLTKPVPVRLIADIARFRAKEIAAGAAPGPASRSAPTATARRLPPRVGAAVDASKILGVRAGAHSQHSFTGVWPVVVEGRVLARSWTRKPGGWYRAFLEDPLGVIQVGERQVKVRAARVRSERIRDAVERAYALKYPTPGSRQYVRGFRTPQRREATIEFLPR